MKLKILLWRQNIQRFERNSKKNQTFPVPTCTSIESELF